MKIQLTYKQEQLKDIIIQNLNICRTWEDRDREEVSIAFDKMKRAAHSLHMQLNPKPKHHGYMIENRGMEPENPEFYNHIHPAEDLLAYLEDDSANDDPIDYTIGDKFEFQIYSNRWGHKDQYELTRTQNGWYVNHMSYKGEDYINSEMETLHASLRHDMISYPNNMGSYLNSIWMLAKDEGLKHNQVQEMLNRVAAWVSHTEINAPTDLLI